ncbi:propanediol utilization protein [Aminithiophilus ramosus]|uniref:Propanediol utilization protein n=2 Tax=Synergistales TaxID=649776 RepID=A0A9Q7ANC4_9BACT|nr:glycerol dehydratase reactivase beta/small subunit family protein [Aminithiophilus ramosus]QTX32027.1 propanediol utilization protein [Aminithiophilus ramosus]QVL35869.1 propanediol utilization protein [Synergistota bacterium]
MNVWCRPLDRAPDDRPAIVLLASDAVDEGALSLVGTGSEEEGIPLVWGRGEGDAVALAQKAARRSRLEVGIGLDGIHAAVTLAKFPGERGAYLRESVAGPSLRWIGQAAACLVKGEHLPPRESEAEGPRPSPETSSSPDGGEDALVARLTRMVMEELAKERRR